MDLRWVGAAVAVACLAGCGATGSPTGVASGVATNPVAQGTGGTAVGSPTAAVPGVRTVLSPLGLNIHGSPAVSAPRLGTAAQGVVLTVLDHSDQGGGWYKVQGQTVTGWIVADPTLTAAGQFTQYQSSDRGFNVLYPQDWTFDASAADVLFHPLNGAQTIVVRGGAGVATFGASGASGFFGSGQQTVIVCGVTAELNQFTHSRPLPATPAPGTAGPLAFLAQIRLRLDATHALALDFNYSAVADLDVFGAFYNSLTFPFPQCMRSAAVAPTP